MIKICDYKDSLKECISIQKETQKYLAEKLPDYNFDPDEIKALIEEIDGNEYLHIDLNLITPFLLWVSNNKCAIDDEFLEILEALGGKYGKAIWKTWKKAHKDVNEKLIDDVLVGEYKDKFYEEMIDLFHFILNLLVILPDKYLDNVLEYVSKKSVITKDDLDEENRCTFVITHLFIYSKSLIDEGLVTLINGILRALDNNNPFDIRKFVKVKYQAALKSILFSFLSMWGYCIESKNFGEFIEIYKNKNNINRNRWNSGY